MALEVGVEILGDVPKPRKRLDLIGSQRLLDEGDEAFPAHAFGPGSAGYRLSTAPAGHDENLGARLRGPLCMKRKRRKCTWSRTTTPCLSRGRRLSAEKSPVASERSHSCVRRLAGNKKAEKRHLKRVSHPATGSADTSIS
jgi:hypothetical protein